MWLLSTRTTREIYHAPQPQLRRPCGLLPCIDPPHRLYPQPHRRQGHRSRSGTPGASISGRAFGGQQALAGAHVYLFAAGTAGYGTASTSLLTAAATGHSDSIGAYTLSDANGNFSVTGDYTCTANTQVYLYVLGGNPGAGANINAGLLAILGNCPGGSLATQVPFVTVNEATTIAAAYSFAGFATDATHVASSGSTLAQTGIANAFSNAATIVSLNATGGALPYTPASNGLVPQAAINTLANILSTCINSASPFTACTTLFTNAKSPAGVTPPDTASAAINIAHSPAANVAALYALSTTNPPFAPALTAAPSDFTLTVAFFYNGSNNVKTPSYIAIDGGGNAWTTSYTSNNIAEFTPNGYNAYYFGGGHLLQPYALAIDTQASPTIYSTATNNTANATATTPAYYLYQVNNAGNQTTNQGGYDPTGSAANITIPAVDGNNVAYQAQGTGTVAQLFNTSTSTGADISSYITYPYAVAVDSNGLTWTTSHASGLAAGSASLLAYPGVGSTATATSCKGTNYASGSGIAVDHANNIWVADDSTKAILKFSNACVYQASYSTGSGNTPTSLAIDGAGSLWTVSSQGNIVAITNAGTSITGATGFTNPLYSTSRGALTGPAIDGSGNVWFTSPSQNIIFTMLGAATPVVTPIAAGVSTNTLGSRP